MDAAIGAWAAREVAVELGVRGIEHDLAAIGALRWLGFGWGDQAADRAWTPEEHLRVSSSTPAMA